MSAPLLNTTSASLLITTALGPDLAPDTDAGSFAGPQMTLDRRPIEGLIQSRDVLDRAVRTLIHEDDLGYQYEVIDEGDLEPFDVTIDSEDQVTQEQRDLALRVLRAAIDELFPLDDTNSPDDTSTRSFDLSNELAWDIIEYGGMRRTKLMTGGLSYGDHPTEAFAPLHLIDEIGLFDQPLQGP